MYKTIGLKTSLMSAILVSCVGFGMVAIWSNPYVVILLDNFIIGIGCGVINVSSLWPLHVIFGNNNATVIGIAIVGFSAGASIYGLILTQIVNPYNLTPTGDNSTNQIYSDSVSERVPMGYLVFAVLTFTVGVISLMLIKSKSRSESDSHIDSFSPALSYKEILKSSSFWKLFWLFYLNYFPMIFLICDYRVIMLKHIHDDHLVSYASTLAAFANNSGSLLWMIVLDYSSFNTIMIAIDVILVGFLATLPMIWDEPVLLISWVCVMWFCCGGLYTGSVYETYNAFPGDTGKKVYPLLTIPWNLSVFSTVGITTIGDRYGYDYAMYILIVMTVASLAIVVFWKDIKHIDTKNSSLSNELILDEAEKSINTISI